MYPPEITTPKPIPMTGNVPAWHYVLRECGYPTDVVLIDFETYFNQDYSLAKMSTVEYVTDPRYEEIGKSILHVTRPFEPVQPCFWWGDHGSYLSMLQDRYGKDLDGCTVVAQNAPFDGLILAIHYDIHPSYCIDTLALLRHENSRQKNDLGTASRREGLPAKGDTSQFLGIHLEDMTGEQRLGMATYANRDAKNEWGLFVRKLPRLSRPGVELRLIQHTLELFWKPALTVDRPFATDLMAKMEGRIDEVVTPTGATRENISGNKSFGLLLSAALDRAGDNICKYQKAGKPRKDGTPVALLAIAKEDPQLEILQSHDSLEVRGLLAARTAIKSWPLHIGRVTSLLNQAKVRKDMIGVPLKYHGAHTGRWSGTDDINFQNLPSRSDDLANAIRQVIVAPEGYELVVVDASQIEARGTTWIAGQDDWNEMWRDPDRDPYCEFASKMAGRAVLNTKKHKIGVPALKGWHDRMRGMGKVGVLGCGYGMGADKAIAFAEAGYGVTLTQDEAQHLVQTYRKGSPMVCRFWREVERCFKFTARYHEPQELPRGLKFHWEEDGDITVLTLPSGRTLKYPGVRVSVINMREQLWMPDPMRGLSRVMVWGGYLTENIVQALSRDILAEAVLATEDAGHHVALHVHDEVVAVVPEGTGGAILKDIVRIMSTSPAWGPDMPLAAEGHVSKRYVK
jgi:DNA polymerase